MKRKIKAVLIGLLIWVITIALIVAICLFKPVEIILTAAFLMFLLIWTIATVYSKIK